MQRKEHVINKKHHHYYFFLLKIEFADVIWLQRKSMSKNES